MRNLLGSRLWNLYSYTYDFYTKSILKDVRKEYIKELLQLAEGEEDIGNLLIVGVGTGQDLSYIDPAIPITAIDYSSKMLKKAKKHQQDNQDLTLCDMDAHNLDFKDNSFDRVLLPLIIAVSENPQAVLSEAVRVLKPGKKMVVFDKFLDKGQKPSFLRKSLNLLAKTLATDINLDFYDLFSETDLTLIKEKPSIFGGVLKILILEKRFTQ